MQFCLYGFITAIIGIAALVWAAEYLWRIIETNFMVGVTIELLEKKSSEIFVHITVKIMCVEV